MRLVILACCSFPLKQTLISSRITFVTVLWNIGSQSTKIKGGHRKLYFLNLLFSCSITVQFHSKFCEGLSSACDFLKAVVRE